MAHNVKYTAHNVKYTAHTEIYGTQCEIHGTKEKCMVKAEAEGKWGTIKFLWVDDDDADDDDNSIQFLIH